MGDLGGEGILLLPVLLVAAVLTPVLAPVVCLGVYVVVVVASFTAMPLLVCGAALESPSLVPWRIRDILWQLDNRASQLVR